MKKLFCFLLLTSVLISCKKDDDNNGRNTNCSNDFPFLQKSATAVYDNLDLLGLFDKVTVTYTLSSSSTKLDFKFTGTSTYQSSLYYSACGSKLYQSKNSNMKDAQLVVDFNTPLNEVFKAKTYSAQGDLVESEYRIVDKSYEFTLDGKKTTAYKVENVQLIFDEYMALGYEIISKEYGQLEYSAMDSKRELVSYE